MTDEKPAQELIDDFLAHFGIGPVDLDSDDDAYMDDIDTVLSHFGIAGMKWGRRRARGPKGLVDKSDPGVIDKSKVAGKRETAKTATKTKIKSMTNEELNATIKRLQLEQQLTQLTAPKKSEAQQFIKDVLLNAGKQEATKFAATYMSKGLAVAMAKGSAALAKSAVKP